MRPDELDTIANRTVTQLKSISHSKNDKNSINTRTFTKSRVPFSHAKSELELIFQVNTPF